MKKQLVKLLLNTRDVGTLVDVLAAFIAIQLKVAGFTADEAFEIFAEECDAHYMQTRKGDGDTGMTIFKTSNILNPDAETRRRARPRLRVAPATDPDLAFDEESQRVSFLLRAEKPQSRVIIASIALCEAAQRGRVRSHRQIREMMVDAHVRVTLPRRG